MEAIYTAVSAVLGLSVASNLVLFIALRRSKKKPPPKLSITAEELLHDLTRGQSVLRVQVIDPSAILLRSPKH